MKLTLLDLSEAKNKLAASALRLTSGMDAWADVFTGIKTASGKVVTREQALRCGAVLACTRILTEDVASLPLILKRKTKQGAEDATNHPGYRLLKSAPNALQTSMEVREHIMMDLILSGHFAVWQQRNGRGNLKALYPLCAPNLRFQGMQRNGDLVWRYNSPELNRDFTQSELWRGQIMSQSVIDGRALILLAREAIGLAIAAEEQGARLFSSGIQTNLTLSTEAELGADGREQLRESLRETYAGSENAWKVLLLESGLKAEKIGLTAQESQYIESRNYQLADIARVFRIPGVLLGIGDKTSTYASAEQFFLSYVKHTLQPWLVRIEQTCDRDLIDPSEEGLFVKHQLGALLRADQKTRYECYQLGINAGWMNRQEPREIEDLNTVPGLDKFLVPANMQILNSDGTIPTPPAPSTPGQPGQPAKPDKPAGRLAENIADAIIRSETREFTRHKHKKDNGAALDPNFSANFAVWHMERVAQLTGADKQAVKEYSEWRSDPAHDPLHASREAEARQRLINLCLGVTL